MEKYMLLFSYIKSQIINIENSYNTSDLLEKLQLYQDNFHLLQEDIEHINLNIIKELLKENYSNELEAIYIKYINVLIDLKKEGLTISKNDILGSKIFEFLLELSNKFINKINKIEEEIKEIQTKKEQRMVVLNKYLSYFDIENKKLIKSLSEDELKELFEYLESMPIELDDIYDIILQITIDNKKIKDKEYENIRLQELDKRIKEKNKRVKRITSHIKDSIQLVETHISHTYLEELLDEVDLVEEDYDTISKIKEVYGILKNENIEDFDNYLYTALGLIQEDKYNLSLRKNLYVANQRFSIWKCICLDLKNNFHIEDEDKFLAEYKNNSVRCREIFTYLIDLYNKMFISKEEVLRELPILEKKSIYDKVLNYKNEAFSLNNEEIQRLGYANYIYEGNGLDALREYDIDITPNHLDYYHKLMELKEKYIEYEEYLNDNINDKKDLKELKSIIEELNNQIISIVYELDNISELIEERRIKYEQLENLPIFLPSKDRKIEDIVEEQQKKLKENYGGNAAKYFRQDIKFINDRLLKVKYLDLDGHDERTRLTREPGNYIEFDKFNAYRMKGSSSICGRVTYLRIELTPYNKEKLMEYFKMNSLDYICLILTLDASLQAEKGYVARSNEYLKEEEEYILKIKNIFENDFTIQTFKEAIDLIKISVSKINDLSVEAEYLKNDLEELEEKGDDSNDK